MKIAIVKTNNVKKWTNCHKDESNCWILISGGEENIELFSATFTIINVNLIMKQAAILYNNNDYKKKI